MAQLTVRNVDDRLVRALKERAARHRRSAEAEHRDILRWVLGEKDPSGASVAERAAPSGRRCYTVGCARKRIPRT